MKIVDLINERRTVRRPDSEGRLTASRDQKDIQSLFLDLKDRYDIKILKSKDGWFKFRSNKYGLEGECWREEEKNNNWFWSLMEINKSRVVKPNPAFLDGPEETEIPKPIIFFPRRALVTDRDYQIGKGSSFYSNSTKKVARELGYAVNIRWSFRHFFSWADEFVGQEGKKTIKQTPYEIYGKSNTLTTEYKFESPDHKNGRTLKLAFNTSNNKVKPTIIGKLGPKNVYKSRTKMMVQINWVEGVFKKEIPIALKAFPEEDSTDV